MLKNSTLYRRLWYVKRRKTSAIQFSLRLAYIFIILLLLVLYYRIKIMPGLMQLCEESAFDEISSVIHNSVEKNTLNGIEYSNLVIINKDRNGRITSVQTDVARMNLVSTEVAGQIDKEMAKLRMEEIKVPLGILLNKDLMGNTGPEFRVKVIPPGKVLVDFKSDYINSGSDRIIHRIELEIRTKVGIQMFLVKSYKEAVIRIPVTEMVFVGNIKK